ncbi:DUF748 domain-containing protein [Marinimicrobium sp. C2-29]|uniref:DUF748 domain-containing protein n=1 Tax=Marinimicrobium sp. C2-29 TaxID=3139825 RepID=UPI003139AF33
MHSGSTRRFGGYLRTQWLSPRRIRFWILLLILLYTLLGFFAVPWIVQYLAVNTAEEEFGRELRIGAVHANPYTLRLRIVELSLDDTDDRELLRWQQLDINLAWSSLINRAWTFQAIHLDEPVIQEERFVSGETRFSRLAAEGAGETANQDEPSPPPALRVDTLRVEGGVLRFADNLQDPTAGADQTNRASLALQGVELLLEDFSLEEGERFPVHLKGELEAGGNLAFDGTLQLRPTPALAGDARVEKLALIPAEPYLRQFVNVRVDDGTLSLSGRLQTDAQQPFAFSGSAGIEALDITDGSNDDSLIGWQSLQTNQLDLRLGERQLETGPINVDGLSGRVVIHEDRTTNFSQLMATPETDTQDDGDKTGANETHKNDADKEPKPFDITIEGIELAEGAVHFADNSLPLPFSRNIHTLGGQVSTLSSTSAEPAEVELEGEIGEYGLVQVDGAVHAWHPMRETTLQLNFRNLQIPEYSPYTVRFAGRKIAGGTMDLDLGYTVKDRQLEGRNNLVLRDLKLGEKMEASNAMDLPLDLAIGLLQDNDGVIDLDLPVSGNVDNPEFDFAQVIRQALGDAIKSVVQAPFRFLANLVGADSEDLGKVEFPEGRTDLLPPERARIAKLRDALNQRQALALQLAGPFNKTFDGPTVQRRKAIEALQQRLAEADREVADPSLTSESNQDIVETMFSAEYPNEDLETIRARFTESQDESSEETSFDALSYRNHLADKLIEAQPVSDADLEAIANDRAEAVRDALVDPEAATPIDADRVRILDPKEIDSVDDERIAMEVGITAN